MYLTVTSLFVADAVIVPTVNVNTAPEIEAAVGAVALPNAIVTWNCDRPLERSVAVT